MQGYTRVLCEDECAPDAREYFSKYMIKETGFNLNQFKEKANFTDTDFELI